MIVSRVVPVLHSRWISFVRCQDGSLTIYSLILFILLLMMSGMAVDMAMHERQRVRMQNTIDAAVMSASSLSAGPATNEAVRERVLNYVEVAGLDRNAVNVTPIVSESSRDVSATATFSVDTIFMGLLGVDELVGGVGSAAIESEELVEIVLVLDVSGSMGNDGKIEALRPAAQGFVTEMFNKLGKDRVRIAIVPYNGQVHLSNAVRDAMDDAPGSTLNWEDELVDVVLPDTAHAGAIDAYTTRNPNSRCARFRNADFSTTDLVATSDVEPSAMFAGRSTNRNFTAFESYSNADGWCSSHFAPLYLFSDNKMALNTYIGGLNASGWTAIDYGLNWAAGILDESFRPVVSHLVSTNALEDAVAGHPLDYGSPSVKKVIVLMTDGQNTQHHDIADDLKSGPSRVWSSDDMGFLVEMPDNPASQRWYVPNTPDTTEDDAYVSELPDDAVQWDQHRLFERFRHNDIADYFFRPDPAARNAYLDARIDSGSFDVADQRVLDICGQIRDQVDVYTIAFQAPEVSETLLRDCVEDRVGRFFDVDTLDIASAFDAIAIELTSLQLTQ